MQERVKIWVVAGVLGLALVLALAFRRNDSPPQVPPPVDHLLILRGDRGHVPVPRKRLVEVPLEEELAPVQAAVRAELPRSDELPPELPPAYSPGLVSIDREGNQDRAPRSTDTRTHKVADGDTLTSLAQRYLGNPARYREIYEANSEHLKSPDVLPIGLVLSIPPRERAEDASVPKPSQAKQSGAEPEQRDNELPPLVPIPR